MAAQPERESLTHHIVSLPLVETTSENTILDEKAALAVFFDLEQNKSTVPFRTLKQVDLIQGEVAPKLDRIAGEATYVISGHELRGLLARAAIAGAAQAVFDIGKTMGEIDIVQKMYETTSDTDTDI